MTGGKLAFDEHRREAGATNLASRWGGGVTPANNAVSYLWAVLRLLKRGSDSIPGARPADAA